MGQGQNLEFLSCDTSLPPQSSVLSKLFAKAGCNYSASFRGSTAIFLLRVTLLNTVSSFTYMVVKLFVLSMYKYVLVNEYTFPEEGLFHTLLGCPILNKNDTFCVRL